MRSYLFYLTSPLTALEPLLLRVWTIFDCARWTVTTFLWLRGHWVWQKSAFYITFIKFWRIFHLKKSCGPPFVISQLLRRMEEYCHFLFFGINIIKRPIDVLSGLVALAWMVLTFFPLPCFISCKETLPYKNAILVNAALTRQTRCLLMYMVFTLLSLT